MNKYDDKIIKYFDGQLSATEKKEFESELEINTDLKNSFTYYSKVNKLFAGEDELHPNPAYFNSIVPRFRQSLEKETDVSHIRKISFAFAAALILISSYLLVQNLISNESATNYSIQSFADNLSDEEKVDLTDYISTNYWNPISSDENLLILDETDFSLEGMIASVTIEEGILILSDYEINDITSLADEEQLETIYNEIITKRIY